MQAGGGIDAKRALVTYGRANEKKALGSQGLEIDFQIGAMMVASLLTQAHLARHAKLGRRVGACGGCDSRTPPSEGVTLALSTGISYA